MNDIPKHDTLRFDYHKTFEVNGVHHQYPVVLYVGNFGGDLWAVPRWQCDPKQIGRYGTTRFWTQSESSAAGDIVRRPEPFGASLQMRSGLVTPMSPEARALVRFCMIRHAQAPKQATWRIEFP
jgi:hypothetical protein